MSSTIRLLLLLRVLPSAAVWLSEFNVLSSVAFRQLLLWPGAACIVSLGFCQRRAVGSVCIVVERAEVLERRSVTEAVLVLQTETDQREESIPTIHDHITSKRSRFKAGCGKDTSYQGFSQDSETARPK